MSRGFDPIVKFSVIYVNYSFINGSFAVVARDRRWSSKSDPGVFHILLLVSISYGIAFINKSKSTNG